MGLSRAITHILDQKVWRQSQQFQLFAVFLSTFCSPYFWSAFAHKVEGDGGPSQTLDEVRDITFR